MPLEENKIYRMRNGALVGPLLYRPTVEPWVWWYDGPSVARAQANGWRADGTFDARNSFTTHPCDIVEEYHANRDVKQVDPLQQGLSGGGVLGDAVELTNERRNQHGDWLDQSYLANSLKSLAHGAPGWNRVSSHQQEALDMILTKVSRIISGDPTHADHWNDIAGYAYLGKGGHK